MAFTLAKQMVRAIGILQAVLSLPVLWCGGSIVIRGLVYPSNEIFAFVEWLCVGLFAAGIIFIVLVQRYSIISRKTNLYFEIAKSSLATGVWIWMIVDAAFGPWRERVGWAHRKPGVTRAAISVVVLFVLYYPTLVWAIIDFSLHRKTILGPEHEEAQAEGDAGERQPLLG